MKLHVHLHIIYIKYKFYEIPSIGFLVMAEGGNQMDGRNDRQTEGGIDNVKPISTRLRRG